MKLFLIGCILCLSHKTPIFKLTGEVNNDSASKVIEYLDTHSGPVTIQINSGGGSVVDASDIEAAIETHDGPVTCQVRGFALSAALSILQSCQVREMTNGSVLMAHEVQITSDGGQRTVEANNTLDSMHALNTALANALSKHSHMKPEEILAKIAGGKEWWLTPQEALAAGLVDKVI